MSLKIPSNLIQKYKVLLTSEDLISFENHVADIYNAAKIGAPVHLSSNNEEELIEIFKCIGPMDWVLCSWRSHYQCLLKGVPPDNLMAAIIEGKSIALNFKKYKIVSSAIVGGIIPIAIGLALSSKMSGSDDKVFCFVGDMTSMTGIFYESYTYARNQNLPLYWIIEDNNCSVWTDTRLTWGQRKLTFEEIDDPNIIYYKYNNKYPHAGAGQWIQF